MMRKKDPRALPKGGGVELTAEDLPFVTYGLPPVISGVREVSVLLHLPERWVNDMVEAGQMPCWRVGGMLNFATGKLMQWLFQEFPGRVEGKRARAVRGNDGARRPKSEGATTAENDGEGGGRR